MTKVDCDVTGEPRGQSQPKTRRVELTLQPERPKQKRARLTPELSRAEGVGLND